MKISEIITKLEEIKVNWGDLICVTPDNDINSGTNQYYFDINTVTKIKNPDTGENMVRFY